MRNPVARFNRMVMRNPLKWLCFTSGAMFGGMALLLVAGMTQEPVGTGFWYFCLVTVACAVAIVGVCAWFFAKFHRLEKKLEAEPETETDP
ncbi:hypothetical protein [Nocardioides alkalitolerans]|uniref:hypothetical protein n=1 Tax=Nocardioides alkalitolerans TaxID=281714 RepID=UPI0012F96D85|nr:hypothetical protein [Nocardioides alkalitolerans]